MPLAPGTFLGPYEILSPLGSGGMGEVYKARDRRLDRIVAIKISKSEFSARFKREAQIIAQLNHPHICQIYDVGDNFLVMEYVDGRPIKGPMPQEQVLRYAAQICDALDTAHRKGIVHRDLKPGNILVAKAGVKLLDFGLAKASSNDPGGDETLPLTLTMDGERLGTPHYMSPEQWNGAEADTRSEIYAFGLVLYEMVKGKRPERHAPMEAVEPPVLDRVIRTCVAADPDARWQSARDLHHVIESIAHGTHTAGASRGRRAPERWAWVAGIALLCGAAYFADARWHRPTAGPSVRLAVSPAANNSFARPVDVTLPVPQFAVSPDGRAIAYVAGEAGRAPLLWVRALDRLEARPIPGTENASQPFWSPDSRWLGFFAGRTLRRVPAEGGPVQEIAAEIPDPRGGTWGRDDVILYSFGNQGIFRVPAEGGEKAAVTAPEAAHGEVSHRWPYFLPDGQHFLYTIRGSQTDSRNIFVGSLDGKTRKRIARFDSGAIFSNEGYILYMDGALLMGQAFDSDSLETSGQPFVVSDRAGRASLGNAAVSVSDSGVLAYAPILPQSGRLTWFNRAGEEQASVGEGDFADFRLSPDERQLAMSRFDPATGNSEIWVSELSSGRMTLLTQGAALNASAAWSPGGDALAFRSNLNGGLEFHRIQAGGGQRGQTIFSLDGQRAAGIESTNLVPTDWSPDGRFLLFSVPTQNSGFSLWTLSMVGEAKASRLMPGTANDLQGVYSPDGSMVAYTSDESGRFEVYVRSTTDVTIRRTVSAGGGYEPRWKPGGGELYYLSEDRRLMAVSVLPGFTFSPPKALFPTRVPSGVSAFRNHFVASRGGRFLIHSQSADVDTPVITVVTNWRPEGGR